MGMRHSGPAELEAEVREFAALEREVSRQKKRAEPTETPVAHQKAHGVPGVQTAVRRREELMTIASEQQKLLSLAQRLIQ